MWQRGHQRTRAACCVVLCAPHPLSLVCISTRAHTPRYHPLTDPAKKAKDEVGLTKVCRRKRKEEEKSRLLGRFRMVINVKRVKVIVLGWTPIDAACPWAARLLLLLLRSAAAPFSRRRFRPFPLTVFSDSKNSDVVAQEVQQRKNGLRVSLICVCICVHATLVRVVLTTLWEICTDLCQIVVRSALNCFLNCLRAWSYSANLKRMLIKFNLIRFNSTAITLNDSCPLKSSIQRTLNPLKLPGAAFY